MMRWAITPQGVGKLVGARVIKDGWPLAVGETFTVDLDSVDGLVLGNDGISVRAETPTELNARKYLPLDVIQSRLEADGAWDTYVNFMFAVTARRNAFLRIMFIGQPILVTDAGLRSTMAGAGLTQAQIDRVLA